MADTFPPNVNFNSGIYVPQLPEEFKISKSALYDYYSTNSGMFPKNPGGGSGGGGGDVSALNSRVADLEKTRQGQADAANATITELSNIKDINNIDEIEDIIGNQMILSSTQYNILSAMG